ncbi:MAG TPA: response regulator transcription factor [Anaerolineales bacterium]|nr:response regulator transcription factor [Anaerolineales bacterium]
MNEKNVRLLVVDDEKPIRRFLGVSLASVYTVLEATTGAEALDLVVSGRPDVILLDLGLPDMDGVELTRRLREWTQIPIIVISVRDREEDKIAALDAGADDYLTKPFGVGELMARLRVILRRVAHPESVPVFQDSHLRVDLTMRAVFVDGRITNLTPTEYDILRVLIQNAGKVLTHQQLIHLVWGNSLDADAHLLRVNISNLRRKIEPDAGRPHYIMTEPGVGYRLKPADARRLSEIEN